MAITKSGHVVLVLFLTFPAFYGQYIENLSIRPLKTGGLQVFMKDFPNMIYFDFQANVNQKIRFGESGNIALSAMSSKNGYWSDQDDNVALKVGDIIHYYVHLGFRDHSMYDKDGLSYTVTELYDLAQRPESPTTRPGVENRSPDPPTTAPSPSPLPPPQPTASCGKSITVVHTTMGPSIKLCSGQIIFEDNFDSLREDLWTIEHYIPSKPEYPFVSYQRSTVSVKDGLLRIEPQLLQNSPGFDSAAITQGSLNLTDRCTRSGACMYQSNGAQILPPIVSGRVTSNNVFTFKYGFVEIKAKVPQGDWLYPDILLEILSRFYGGQDNRVLRIVGARGNKLLTKGTEEYGNKVLYGGPMVDVQCRNLLVQKVSSTEWGNDFHVYSMSWTPDMITLFVDGEEWGRVNLTPSDLDARLAKDTCKPLRSTQQTPVTSFDDFFGITLGVSAGGILEFPDGVMSGLTTPKPWRNTENKARLNFLRATNTWQATWQPAPALLVDYIRVRAL